LALATFVEKKAEKTEEKKEEKKTGGKE